MRIRCKPWAKPELEACDFCINEPEQMKNKWREEFKNDAPLYLELGCGKGGFISQAAPDNPGINYIAVDIKNEMLVLAKRKLEEAYKEKNMPLDNVRIFIKNVEQIDNVFGPEDKIDRIYINFCNPWPKPKHKKRRLTHIRQLEKYKTFLNGEIWFKTDDDDLFKESFQYFEDAGFEIKYKTSDLHNSEYQENNYVTEHEKMFTQEGKKIKFLIAGRAH
ncbi:tRNA (guanosine(46)-N7)-methyltransferase TrmB [Porcipelethomonas sp.]|uniref:tRNA (guanosine(46)-N7)-methyltransferase TrmB n=1 Tax=Porcipelethomonas sp. TaxID=2981675 RepID=UPI003EF22FDC